MSSHPTTRKDFPSRGDVTKDPLEEKKNVKKFSQKPKKNHVKDSMNPPWENRKEFVSYFMEVSNGVKNPVYGQQRGQNMPPQT